MNCLLQLTPKDIAFLVKIFEGYEHLAVVKTLDGKQGIVELIFPPSTATDVHAILDHFPRSLIKQSENA